MVCVTLQKFTKVSVTTYILSSRDSEHSIGRAAVAVDRRCHDALSDGEMVQHVKFLLVENDGFLFRDS